MKGILIALATAGTVASVGVTAATFPVEREAAAAVRVQYSDNHWDDRSMNINDREARINERIRHGVSDGRITNREARRLYGQLHAIEAKERAFKSDGRLDRREAAELNDDLDRLAMNVRTEMRDEQRRY